ncbi:uncharacterized protein LOC8278046 [Ricinus communis]|uniref:Uncharacterized protein n=1 Tax=Ricinus communis TaxID=3988 RepID=B9T3I6_RICCO|nr:uncharacterized protein LOC8278046 [Ricinus communis]EEF29562.1 hypothetical protein RCOM_1263540 [Ricinus communis]|eukprot:XP_002532805.1 uncharacterized protein LOC8278046 [Ricinus communis]
MAYCTIDTPVPLRSPYINLHGWPEPNRCRRSLGVHGTQARVVDSRSCRQMYLRSYTFSRKESFEEKTKKRFGKVRERINRGISRKRSSSDGEREYSLRRVPCAALLSMFRRLMVSCTTKVDIAED